ncbi:MAG: magnesium transporter CorA family protein [Bacteroides sp.]|nr:magnesium transporter CorA family protein [Bacillota bacterium]MCM1394410.1 magnesium transporter CorA family protein [[Eubacterium] siraeum]MCM1456065.1 magnesium transporter CorA family protein [Bacteroides sp.]
MFQVYKKINKSVVEVDRDLIVDGYDFADQWIHMSNPTDKELEFVSQAASIPEDYLKAALDSEERAHIEKEDGIIMSVTDIPITEEDDDNYAYATLPFGCIFTDKTIVTVCLNETSVIYDLLSGRFIRDLNIHKRARFFLQLQYVTAKKYLQYLKQIDRASQRVQTELEKSMKNEELIEMLTLEKALVYFSTSLRSNAAVLDKIPRLVKFYEEDEDLWEDVQIENRQAIEMSNIYREILNSTMDSYSSIISNNLNKVMKTLTILTLMVDVPAMIGSLWGMNTGVPFESKWWGFWVVVAINVVICIIMLIILGKKNMFK